MGLLQLDLTGGGRVLAYAKGDAHEPASFTILNFPVADVEAAVDALAAKGVEFERYDGFDQDEQGIARGQGPTIAWFTRPGRQHPVGARGAVTEDRCAITWRKSCTAVRGMIGGRSEGAPMTDAILAEGLVKRYKEVTALDGIDLRVPEGSVLGAARAQRRRQDHGGARS